MRSQEVTTWKRRTVSKLMDGTQRELREMGPSREGRKKGGWIDVQTDRLTDEGNSKEDEGWVSGGGGGGLDE